MPDLRGVVAEAISDSLSAAAPDVHMATAGDVLDAMAAPTNRAALVAWLVEAGVLERPSHGYFGRTFQACLYDGWTDDRGQPHPMVAKMSVDPDAVPLYRIGGGA